MSIIANNLLQGDEGYNISRSLRFRSSASAYLNRTPASAGNRKTFTWSSWGKISVSSADLGVISSYSDNNNRSDLRFGNGNSSISFYNIVSGSVTTNLTTTQVFRDPSAWYHIVLAVDTTQSTESNRVKLYINGTQVIAFSTATYPAQNNDFFFNSNVAQYIGATGCSPVSNFYDGYLTEVNFIDGQALTPSSFGETDPITGVWKAKKYGGTYGTNGFYLPFTDVATTSGSNAGLGKDFSGNGNYWNTNNISVTAGITYDSMNDVPTLTGATQANYCVLNPTDKAPDITISNGNLTATAATGVHNNARTTMGCGTTGYWYMEFTYTGSIGGSTAIAVGLYDPAFRIDNGTHPVTTGDGFYGLYASAGAPYMYTNGGNPSVAVSGGSAGDILQLAYDVAGGKLWFGLNNVWYDSSGGTTGNPSTGANATITTVATNRIFGFDIVSNTINFNFGQRPFSYTPPTGFLALNTFNLPEPSIKAGNAHFDATTYSGTGSSQSIVNSGGFQPSLVWLKTRNVGYGHALFDAVRGVGNGLQSNSTNAEAAWGTSTLASFNSNGFGLGADTSYLIANSSGNTFVGWQWKGNGAGSSNTAGSITSTVSANPTAGFSVVTYTGTGSAATTGHGLGVAPKMIICKNRSDGSTLWSVYHASVGAGSVAHLNTTDAFSSSGDWNSTTPTSSVYSTNGSSRTNASGQAMVAYCFAEVAGYSKFGSYTGNGSSDGTFVHLGFRPKFILTKRTNTSGDWFIWDTVRNTYNAANLTIWPNYSSAEYDYGGVWDILSNGFKARTNSVIANNSGDTYIYMAFAENPFKYSLAR